MHDRDDVEEPGEFDVSRRGFLKGAGLTIAAVGLTGSAATPAQQGDVATVVGPGPVEIEWTINGRRRKLSVAPTRTLLDAVRDDLGITGPKRVCDRGACGACTVLVNGRTTNSCSMLAVDAAGAEIRTVEGITPGEGLTPLQEAMVECDALQCGFCTPGMVVALTSLLERNPTATRDQVRSALAGNLCRCGTYQNLFEAVELAQLKMGQKGGRRARF